jgi:membrane protein DedA with SNARE-associated domain
MAWFQKFGAPVLIVPAMLPPPMPFKVFIVIAGMSDLRPLPFITAVAIGRGLRYGGEAWLARTYGETAIVYLERNALDLLWPVLGLSVVAAAAWWVWNRRRRQRQT